MKNKYEIVKSNATLGADMPRKRFQIIRDDGELICELVSSQLMESVVEKNFQEITDFLNSKK